MCNEYDILKKNLELTYDLFKNFKCENNVEKVYQLRILELLNTSQYFHKMMKNNNICNNCENLVIKKYSDYYDTGFDTNFYCTGVDTMLEDPTGNDCCFYKKVENDTDR